MKRRGKRQTQESPASTSKKGKPSLCEKKGKTPCSKRRELTGGILKNIKENYTSYVVNIRPSKWVDKFKPSQFWIGKLDTFERVQLIADAVYFYVGKPAFHFKDAVNLYPSITCMGISEVLSTQEMFRRYTSAIAKGVEYKPQRDDFIAQVKDVLKMVGFPNFPAPPEDAVEHDEGEDTPDVPFLRADHGVISPKRDEVEDVVVSPKGDDDEHDEGEDTPDMEDDKNAAMAIRMSSNELSAAAGVNTVPGSDPVQAFVPIFDFQEGELASGLYSVGRYFDSSTSQLSGSRPLSESNEDCPTSPFSGSRPLSESNEDFPTSPDEEDDQKWKQWMDDLVDQIEP